MAMNDLSPEEPVTPVATKKPYEKPAFRHEQVFVTSALSCGKVPGTSFGCNASPNVS
jgi:hypothetical protein